MVGLRSKIGTGCTIKDAMIMGSDYYETEVDQAAKQEAGVPIIGKMRKTMFVGFIVYLFFHSHPERTRERIKSSINTINQF